MDGEYGAYDICCYGHYEYDGFPDFIGGDTSKTLGLTNREYVDNSDPSSMKYNMPYIYDSLGWSHCADSALTGGDYDVDDLLETIYESQS